MNRSQVADITKEYCLAPNKKFGQNFLINETEIKKIISVLKLEKNMKLLEIGPGLAAITEKLVEAVSFVTAVEIDSGIVRYLKDHFSQTENFKLIHSDFLKIEGENKFDLVVSNLPYYCASEILFKIALEYGSPPTFVMLQKEMAERIVSKPSTKEYGALSVTLGLYYNCEILFHINNGAFYPAPDVTSSFLKLLPRDDIKLNEDERILFHLFVKSAFWARRKTLLASLSKSPHLDFTREEVEIILNKSEIDPKKRGESLSVEQFVTIAKNGYRLKNG